MRDVDVGKSDKAIDVRHSREDRALVRHQPAGSLDAAVARDRKVEPFLVRDQVLADEADETLIRVVLAPLWPIMMRSGGLSGERTARGVMNMSRIVATHS